MFEARVERALTRLGVPSRKDINALAKRVEELTAEVSRLSGSPAKKSRARKTKTAKGGKSAAA